ncbi:hypothetical protein KSP39_PZI007349 [Platanthera zijinensis]|uniref:Uncharacterized protein n=1 Tax=Platanthera zijinensis TaxID=2320716 RepID=A0AAP0BSW3_9ASPA
MIHLVSSYRVGHMMLLSFASCSFLENTSLLWAVYKRWRSFIQIKDFISVRKETGM